MNILQISTFDGNGGAGKVAHVLHSKYRSAGHRVGLLVRAKTSDDPDVHVIRSAGLEWLEQQLDRAEKYLGWQYLTYPSTFLLRTHPAFRQADIVQLHNTHGFYFGQPALPALSRAKPTVWTLHDMWALTGHCAHSFDCERWRTGCGRCPYLGTYPPLKHDTTAFLWQVKRKAYGRSRVTIVAPSNWLRSKLEASLLARFHCELIPNGIDLQVFNPLSRLSVRPGLGIALEARVIAFTVPAEWDEYRGFDFLVNALRGLPASGYHLLAMGARSLPRDLEERFVTSYMGWIIDEHRMAQVLSSADLYLQPSLADTAPLAVIEAMACGTPVIGTNVGGIPEMVRTPQAGFIVPLNDAPALSRAIQTFFQDDDLGQRMSINAREIAERDYGINLQVERYLRLYEQTIEERKRNERLA